MTGLLLPGYYRHPIIVSEGDVRFVKSIKASKQTAEEKLFIGEEGKHLVGEPVSSRRCRLAASR